MRINKRTWDCYTTTVLLEQIIGKSLPPIISVTFKILSLICLGFLVGFSSWKAKKLKQTGKNKFCF
jgi:hypothetical protein